MTLGWCRADTHLLLQGANASSLGRMFWLGPGTEPCPPPQHLLQGLDRSQRPRAAW